MKILTNPHFLLTLTSIFWAFNTVAGRAAVGEVSPLLIVSVRWFFVSIILSILCRNLEHIKQKNQMANIHGFIWLYWF